MMITPLRVLVAADDPLARGGLAALLAGQSDCVVAGQIAASTDILSDVDVYRPDVVLWDVGWEAEHGVSGSHPEALTALQDAGYPVVMLLPDRNLVTDAWALGMRGLLFRDADADRLIASLQAVGAGLAVLDPELAMSLLPPAPLDSAAKDHVLTSREQEVLQLLAEGLPNKSIADRLRISDHTVKFHVNAIMSKLGAQSRTDAVVRATRQGLLLL
ncbi:MAG: response regulator transcription factor [Candidatus Tectomicrobia bacterium]|nr:response regulator transcription factor [Candidatus Tectomicrobia bacterium]